MWKVSLVSSVVKNNLYHKNHRNHKTMSGIYYSVRASPWLINRFARSCFFIRGYWRSFAVPINPEVYF